MDWRRIWIFLAIATSDEFL